MDQPGAPHGETGGQPGASGEETFNPWSVVNLVFEHLAAQGLHPVLGETGDPGRPAADPTPRRFLASSPAIPPAAAS